MTSDTETGDKGGPGPSDSPGRKQNNGNHDRSREGSHSGGNSREPSPKRDGRGSPSRKSGKYNDRNGRSNRGSYYRGRAGKNNKGNIKSRYDEQETDDKTLIRQQVEFYFSDENLSQDKYLFNLVGGPKNNAVDIKVIHAFKRMQRFQPYSVVVEALKLSDKLEVLEAGQDAQVKRKIPLAGDIEATMETIKVDLDNSFMKRSIYAKGFGDEEEKSQLEIEQFFRPYGSTSVRLRRNYQNYFKGSVFVMFEDEDQAQQFLDLEEKPKWKGNDLKIMSKGDYCKEKENLINEGEIRPNNSDDDKPRGNGHRGHRGGRDGRGFRGSRGGRGGRGSRSGEGNRDRNSTDEKYRKDKGHGRSNEDLREKDWQELAAEDRKAKSQKQEYEDNGIPKVMSTAATDEKKTESAPDKTEDKVEAEIKGRKRSRDEAGAEDGGDVKKAKVEGDEKEE